MKLIIVGASRGIGLATVEAALKAGHRVTAFSRHASIMKLQHPRLKLVDGDVLDPRAVKKAIAGHDAVICTLGIPTRRAIGPPLARKNYILSKGTVNIITAMEALGKRRILCVTAIGAGDSVKSCTTVARLGLRLGLRWLYKEKDRQEKLLKSSSLDWTVIRPTALTNGKKHQKLDGGKGRYGVSSHVSRADVANTMVHLLSAKATYKRALILSYSPRFGDSMRWMRDNVRGKGKA